MSELYEGKDAIRGSVADISETTNVWAHPSRSPTRELPSWGNSLPFQSAIQGFDNLSGIGIDKHRFGSDPVRDLRPGSTGKVSIITVGLPQLSLASARSSRNVLVERKKWIEDQRNVTKIITKRAYLRDSLP